ncbi:SGNH/GDSL hydrolase family protein [Kitasatospora sp. NPDC002040]|uniref:SGNH/GDSL hydrolase family protein n=1 Tax=Kitasatospora sp. NPDC002040 TaxID=3154661 RepID=UPI003319943D
MTTHQTHQTDPANRSDQPAQPEQIERLVRSQRPEQTLRFLGEPDRAALAALFGLDPARYGALLDRFDGQARAAAHELTAEPGFAARAARLPFAPGQHVVAIGESTTADRLSWFEVLRHLLPDGVRLTNLAVPGSTTTQALAQLPFVLGFQRPDWVLCMLGANDAQRIDGTPLVSPAETQRNLAALHDLTAGRTAARWVWLTPTGVDPQRVADYPHFRRAGLTWSEQDLDAVADFLLTRPEPVVDTRPAGRGRYQEDGLHLTPAGQQSVARALVDALAGPTR